MSQIFTFYIFNVDVPTRPVSSLIKLGLASHTDWAQAILHHRHRHRHRHYHCPSQLSRTVLLRPIGADIWHLNL